MTTITKKDLEFIIGELDRGAYDAREAMRNPAHTVDLPLLQLRAETLVANANKLQMAVERMDRSIIIDYPNTKPEPAQPIIITVRGGVAWLEDDTNPQGVPISIRDYDIEGRDPDTLKDLPVDDEGNSYEERGNV